MSFRTPWRLFLGCCLAAAALAFLRWNAGRPRDVAGPGAGRLLTLTGDDLAWLCVEKEGWVLEARRDGGLWKLRRPLDCRADEEAIARLLSTLERLAAVDRITEAQQRDRELTLADFALHPPQTRLLFGGPAGRHRLDLGADTWLGQTLYARLDDSSDVLLLPRSIRTALPSSPHDWRDRALLPIEPDRVARLEIRRPGAAFLQLAAVKGGWVLQQPLSCRADSARVRTLLEALAAARIRRFVWDPPASGTATLPAAAVGDEARARLQTWGLADDEAVRVTLWTRGEDIGAEIRLGKPAADSPDEIYASRRASDAVYAVDRAVLDLVSVSAADLRDWRLFSLDADHVRQMSFQEADARLVLERTPSGWHLREPVRWRADDAAVEALLRRTLSLTAAALAPGPPFPRNEADSGGAARRIELTEGDPTAAGDAASRTGRVERLRLTQAADGESTVRAKLDHDETVFELAARDVDGLQAFPPVPHRFFDRTVLTIPAGSVRRLTRRDAHGDQIVELGNPGGWTAAAPAGGRVLDSAVRTLLGRLERLNAERIVDHHPPSLEPYGLSDPAMTLAITLQGADDIQKVLLFGRDMGAGGCYAMIRGQDMVFVLKSDTARELSSPLVVSPSAGPPAKP